MRLRLLWLICLALPLLAAGTEIVPGERVGSFRLGMSSGELKRQLGPPSRTRPNDVSQVWTYTRLGLEFDVGRDGVDSIRVLSPRYATVEGIKVGTGLAEVKAALGPPDYRDDSLWAYCRDDRVELMLGVRDGKVSWLDVIRVGPWW